LYSVATFGMVAVLIQSPLQEFISTNLDMLI
jgi:hypothetical protein